ncbi:uncharacterized protein LOC131939452 isoform X2 [Physella acuta]|uniref:uncharacterized protein LOC131939452 isoform X2 n=1 Tax=Physella acuta TaxID=109671 RepID=UPI0027DE8284|nr:uncharacterized protein LOC131939452 isoform X2 [Physella acuta]
MRRWRWWLYWLAFVARSQVVNKIFLAAILIVLFSELSLIRRTNEPETTTTTAALTSPFFNITNLEYSNVERRHKLIAYRCYSSKNEIHTTRRKPIRQIWRKKFNTSIRLLSAIITTHFKPNILFCPVGKVASTFLTRYIITLVNHSSYTTPYDVPIKQSKRSMLQSLMSIKREQRPRFIKESFKFFFTRNPFSRIFSAYIDKIFTPNPFYWTKWGKKIVTSFKLSSKNYVCGSNIPFRYFVKYVLIKLHKEDTHVMPVHNHCPPCQFEWNMVGRLEDVDQDLHYLSQQLNVSSSYMNSSDYKLQALKDIIKDSSTEVLGPWMVKISKCVSRYNAGRMIWRKLQIRGIIDKHFPLPVSEAEMKQISVHKFQEICLSAALRSNQSNLRLQKQEAIQEAYRTIDIHDMVQLQTIYEKDFFYFGYKNTLENYDPKRNLTEKGILDWRKPWIL